MIRLIALTTVGAIFYIKQNMLQMQQYRRKAKMKRKIEMYTRTDYVRAKQKVKQFEES